MHQMAGAEICDMMFVILFQRLVKNLKMATTEAEIRQLEKGALLGPGLDHAGFAANRDRELYQSTTMQRRGVLTTADAFIPQMLRDDLSSMPGDR